jgi:hypothetical protein
MLKGIPEQRKKRKEAGNSENVHFYERNKKGDSRTKREGKYLKELLHRRTEEKETRRRTF